MTKYEKLVQERQQTKEYAFMFYGVDYYNSDNTEIMGRKKQIFVDGAGIQTNPFAANHKLPSGHFKKIVDQKIGYLLGNGLGMEEEEELILSEYRKGGFEEGILQDAKEASKKAEAWAYFYKDNGKLQFASIPPEQLTPVYDDVGELIEMIRIYKTHDKKVMLVWDKKNMTQYEKPKDSAGEYEPVGVFGHYQKYSYFNGKQQGEPELHSFHEVPFIPLYNNDERTSDLKPVKAGIDVYDVVLSDFANNIDDMQDAYFTIKGYTGDLTDLGKFMQQLKDVKVVPVADDGDVKSHQLQVPVEARKEFLERIERDIYKFAMAVDLSKEAGNQTTATEINALFTDLDLKADGFEKQVRRYITDLVNFINKHDAKSFEGVVIFERSMINNRKEAAETNNIKVDTLIKLRGQVSDALFLEMLAALDIHEINIEQETKRIEAQEEPYRLDPPGGDGQ